MDPVLDLYNNLLKTMFFHRYSYKDENTMAATNAVTTAQARARALKQEYTKMRENNTAERAEYK